MHGGDEDLDAAIVAAYPGLLGYARLLTGDRARAEDAVHEALVRCLRRGRRVPIREFVPYARRAVLNEVIRAAGRRRREPNVGPAEFVRPDPWQHGVAHAPPPQDAALDQQVLRTWLARLAPRQRAAIVARYYLDLSEQDTAELLSCTASAVKSLCHRGIALLRDQVGDEDAGLPATRTNAPEQLWTESR